MTLSSSSTLVDAVAAYKDNQDWEDGAGNITKAREFRSACRHILVGRPSSAGSDNTNASFDTNRIGKDLDYVTAWLQVNDKSQSAGSVTYLDLRTARQ